MQCLQHRRRRAELRKVYQQQQQQLEEGTKKSGRQWRRDEVATADVDDVSYCEDINLMAQKASRMRSSAAATMCNVCSPFDSMIYNANESSSLHSLTHSLTRRLTSAALFFQPQKRNDHLDTWQRFAQNTPIRQ